MPDSPDTPTENGIIRCYDLFPTQFDNIEKMTDYLDEIAKMGFNALWINPIQQSGDVLGIIRKPDKASGVRNEVTRSRYAMASEREIDRRFSMGSAEKDTKALKAFTDKAKKLGITPMFDLVLNHVAADSQIQQEHPEWFERDPVFIDAVKFKYGVFDEKLNKYVNSEHYDAILKFWKDYIDKYINEYGFTGVRVDAVLYLYPPMRAELYKHIHQRAKEKNVKGVILDEALFSGDTPIDQAMKQLGLPEGQRPTHITGSIFYTDRNKFGGLPAWVKNENGWKHSITEGGGCVNFCGNHDHNSVAMTILLEMAKERLKKEKPKENAEHKVFDYHYLSSGDEELLHLFLYSYVQEILKDIKENNEDVKADFQRRVRDKIAMVSLTSSGGYFALSGDESGDITPKFVFERKGAKAYDYYPQREHRIFGDRDESKQTIIETSLRELAESIVLNPPKPPKSDEQKFKEAYLDANESDKLRLLQPYIQNIKDAINAGVDTMCDSFKQKLKSKGGITIDFNQSDYQAKPRNAQNQWCGIDPSLKEYMTQINHVLAQFPASKPGFWSELINLPERPDLAIAVRKNGFELESETNIAIVNLKPGSGPVNFTKKDKHDLAVEFQKRVIPEDEREIGKRAYDIAYTSVMNAKVNVDQRNILVETLEGPKLGKYNA